MSVAVLLTGNSSQGESSYSQQIFISKKLIAEIWSSEFKKKKPPTNNTTESSGLNPIYLNTPTVFPCLSFVDTASKH